MFERHIVNYCKQMLLLFSAIVVSCVVQAMDNDIRDKTHEMEQRKNCLRENTLRSAIENSYLSDGAKVDFISLDRTFILMELRKKIDSSISIEGENHISLDHHIDLLNKISLYDKKIRLHDQAMANKLYRVIINLIWYLLPSATKPQPQTFSVQLPIEQQRILFELLKKDGEVAMPTAEKIKTFFALHLNNEDHVTEADYTWKKGVPPCPLPATFCNGLVQCTASGERMPLDMSPEPNEAVLPATQYWRYRKGITRMSDDITHTDVTIPGCYSLFDASQSHFVGLSKNGNTNTIRLFELPRKVRKYDIYTSKENNVTEVQDIIVKNTNQTIEKPIFTHKKDNVSALIACQQTKEIVYSVSRDNDSLMFIQKIKKGATFPLLSIVVDGIINQIVQLDCSNFICLTQDRSLHRVTRKFDNNTEKVFLQNKKLESDALFSRIAVDHNTNLSAVIQAGVNHKNAIYTIDKNILKTSDIIHKDYLQKIQAENPFKNDLKEYEDVHCDKETLIVDEECFATSRVIAPKLQCHNGAVIAWYPEVATMYGGLSFNGPLLVTHCDQYSAIRTFKTNFQDMQEE